MASRDDTSASLSSRNAAAQQQGAEPAMMPLLEVVPKDGRRYRILTMDGGPSTVDYLRQLRVIEHNRPGFLAKVDCFAGTSDGAWSALFLASRPPGKLDVGAIDAAIAFNRRVVESMRLGPFGLLRLASGGFSAIGNRDLLRDLERAYGPGPDGQPLKMRDVPRDACAVSFHLGEQPKKPGARLFHNLLRHGQAMPSGADYNTPKDLDLTVAEVALRSGSFPILMPVREGYADGGLFANNPAMAALTLAMEYRSVLDFPDLGNVTVMSCGADDAAIGGRRVKHAVENKKDLDWGWIPWLLLPWAPLIMVDAVVTASGRGISYQCRQLLGPRFERLGPSMGTTFGEQVLRLISGRYQKLYNEADDRVMQWAMGADSLDFRPSLKWTLEWVDQVWMPD